MRNKIVYVATCLSICIVSTAVASARLRVLTADKIAMSRSSAGLAIQAKGTTKTAGWKAPQLKFVSYSSQELVLEFVAIPPTGNVPQIITPISAVRIWKKAAAKRVRVLAEKIDAVADVPTLESKAAVAEERVQVVGRLTNEGVECQAMRQDVTNKLYTLTGDLNGFKTGDHVRIVGVIAELSTCMQEKTIVVTSISAAK